MTRFGGKDPRRRWLPKLPTRLLLGLLLSAGAGPGARGETLTVATYNLENYVATNRMVAGVYSPGYPKPETEKAVLRKILRSIDADVLAIEEMGTAPYFDELRRDLEKEGLNYPYAELMEAADADRHTAILAKRPFVSVRKHVDLSFKYFDREEPVKRGLIEAHIATDAGEVTFFVVHLKSRITDRSDDPNSQLRRSSEAVAVRDRILQIFPDPTAAQFVILGDFNDSSNSRPLRALGTRGKTQIATLVPSLDSRGESWTHYFRKEDIYSRVDFILVSPGLKSAVLGGKARIYDDTETTAASDHRPVVVKFRLEKSK